MAEAPALRVYPPDEVGVRPCPVSDAEAEAEPARCTVCLWGQPLGEPVSGLVLEAAVAVGDRYLVFLTDDVPMEDTLSVHLIDRAGQRLDSVLLGHAYSTGRFADLRLQPPDAVRFRFIGGFLWTVRVLPNKALRLPFLGDPRGVSRPFGFSGWLQVLQAPGTGEPG